MGKSEMKEEKKGWFPFIGKDKKEPEKQESEMKEKFKEGAKKAGEKAKEMGKKAGEAAKKGGKWLGQKLMEGVAKGGAEIRKLPIRAQIQDCKSKREKEIHKIGLFIYDIFNLICLKLSYHVPYIIWIVFRH